MCPPLVRRCPPRVLDRSLPTALPVLLRRASHAGHGLPRSLLADSRGGTQELRVAASPLGSGLAPLGEPLVVPSPLHVNSAL